MTVSTQITDLIARGALFVVNHSGGKDSQAMMIELLRIVPREQVVVVHASLGEVEWHGALELAQKQAADASIPFIVARARHADGSEKTFFTMVEKRFAHRPDAPSFPGPKYRQCTSDLKRGRDRARGHRLRQGPRDLTDRQLRGHPRCREHQPLEGQPVPRQGLALEGRP